MRRSKRLQASQTLEDDRQEDTVERNAASDHEEGNNEEGDGENGIHLAVPGDRYAIPSDEFEQDGEDGGLGRATRYAVVSRLERGTTLMWFDGDEEPTRYRGRLRHWTDFLLGGDPLSDELEEMFLSLEVLAGVRREAPPVVQRGSRNQRRPSERVESSGSEDDESNDEGGVVETWESDYEDDENEMAPDVDDAGDDEVDNDMDVELGRARWVNVERLVTDPRAPEGSMPEDISPVMLFANFRGESWLNWFLHWLNWFLHDGGI